MKKYHTVSEIHFEADDILMTIDGICRRCSLAKVSPILKNASVNDRRNFEISPSGYGISWPLLDEDLSIDALLGIVPERRFKKKVA